MTDSPPPVPPPCVLTADELARQRARIEHLFRHIDPADAATRRLAALVRRFRGLEQQA